jgi:leucine dehydrogenase
MNTGEADMDVIGERTEYVFGPSKPAAPVIPRRPTAVGVFHGIRASLAHVFGSDGVEGRRVLVQGVGGVGSALAEHLANAGAAVLVADVDPTRAQAVAARVNAEAVAADSVVEADCDVYAPCAVGGILNVDIVPRLRCSLPVRRTTSSHNRRRPRRHTRWGSCTRRIT